MALTLKQLQINGTVQVYWNDPGPPAVKSANNRGLGAVVAIGTGLNAANKAGIKKYTIAGAGTQDVDLTALVDPEGAAVSLAKVRGILVELVFAANGASSIEFGPLGAAANPLASLFNATTQALEIANGGFNLWYNPTAAAVAVSGGSKVLHIKNNDGANTATVVVTFFGE